MVCDPITNGCAKPDNETIPCKACESLMNTILNDGCAEACGSFPENVTIECLIINELKLCDWIVTELEKFASPASVCEMFGLCGGRHMQLRALHAAAVWAVLLIAAEHVPFCEQAEEHVLPCCRWDRLLYRRDVHERQPGVLSDVCAVMF